MVTYNSTLQWALSAASAVLSCHVGDDDQVVDAVESVGCILYELG